MNCVTNIHKQVLVLPPFLLQASAGWDVHNVPDTHSVWCGQGLQGRLPRACGVTPGEEEEGEGGGLMEIGEVMKVQDIRSHEGAR